MVCAAWSCSIPPMMSIRGMRLHWAARWSPPTTRAAAAAPGAPTRTPSRSCGGSPDHPRLAAWQPEYPLGDDVALDLGGTSGDRAGKASRITLEPAGEIVVEVHRRIGSGLPRVDERVGAGTVQGMFKPA